MKTAKAQTNKKKTIPDNVIAPESCDETISEQVTAPIKKRGRKPKGGKILDNSSTIKNEKVVLPNVIIHLKCSMKDLEYKHHDIESYNNNDSTFELIDSHYTPSNRDNNHSPEDTCVYDNGDVQKKELNKKLKELEVMLHLNDLNCNNQSACFWCTYEFDNSPIYIPKHFIREGYEVYGCFCSPECSCAFLMNEHIDMATKFERYHLLNNIYGKIYNYKQNIKPAPNPYYTLSKFNGNLTIQEFRSLFRFERLFLIVDKPLTKILPELHEDNDEFILNNKSIPSSNYNIKKKNNKKVNKNDIINDKFGLV